MSEYPLGDPIKSSVIIGECSVFPGHDGTFDLWLFCESGGVSFGCNVSIAYDTPLDELVITKPSGDQVTITSRNIAEYLSAGYDFERESRNYLAALIPYETPRIAFTVRDSSIMGGGPIILYRYINWLADLGVEVTVYSDDFPPTWITLNARFRRILDVQQRYAAISEPIVIVYSIIEVPNILRHADTHGKRIYHLCQGAEEFHSGRPLKKDLLYPIPISDILNSLPVGRIVVSPHLKRYFAQKYRQQTTTILNGINLEAFAPVVKSPRQGSYTVLVSGNPLHPLKGVAVVKHALDVIATRHPDWRLHLVNVCGEQLPNAGEQHSTGAITSEIRCGLSPQEMRAMYHEVDVYVNASWYEGFGLPSLEAMASGTPLIHADNHGLDGIVENEVNCLVVPVGDHEALATALERLFTNPDLCRTLIEGGIKTSAKFSLKNQYDMFIEAFSAIMCSPLSYKRIAPAGLTAQPLFSVLVPCYNQGHFLTAALDSLLAQTYGNWEAVVVNDGSTDATAQVMENYAARDPRIRCFHKQNGGVASALNRGISEARGEWICWLSSDDLFLPEKLALHRDIIAADPGLRFMQTNYQVLYEESGVTTPSSIPVKEFIPPQELQLARFLEINYFNGISIAVHRNVFSVVGLFNEEYHYGQDFDLWMRISSRFRSRFIDSATCITRIHPGQGTNLFTEAGIYDSARAALDFLNHNRFEALFPQLVLSQPEQAIHAIGAVVMTLLNRDAFINCCGFRQALVERFYEWLTTQAPENVRLDVIQSIQTSSLGQSHPLLPLVTETAAGCTYEEHNAYEDLKRQLALLEQNGNDLTAFAIRRYLKMINSASSSAQKPPQEHDNHADGLCGNIAVADNNRIKPSTPFFTVVVPTYNQANFLPAALDSLLAQTCADWEAVIINDGSTDDTALVAATYANRDHRIRVFHQENGGVARALNAGLSNAQGEWICWLSSDDLFEPDKLAIHADAIRKNPEGRFFYSGHSLLYEELGVKAEIPFQEKSDRDLQVLNFFRYNWVHGNSFAVHRTVIEKLGGFVEGTYHNAQDFEMWFRISTVYQIYYIPHHTCVTRVHQAQPSTQFFEAGKLDGVHACYDFLNTHHFPDLFPSLDLSRNDAARKAIIETVRLYLEPDAHFHAAGYNPALLERLFEWLKNYSSPDCRSELIFFWNDLLRQVLEWELPAELRDLLQSFINCPQEQYKYVPHNFLQTIINLSNGTDDTSRLMKRYLAEHLLLQAARDKVRSNDVDSARNLLDYANSILPLSAIIKERLMDILHTKHSKSMSSPHAVVVPTDGTLEKHIAQQGCQIPIENIYPLISSCSDKNKALFYAYIDFGNKAFASSVSNQTYLEIARDSYAKALDMDGYDAVLAGANLALAHAHLGEWDSAMKLVIRFQFSADAPARSLCDAIKSACYSKNLQPLLTCSPLTFNKHNTELFAHLCVTDVVEPCYEATPAPDKSYDLITISFFHKRLHLARRMLDTLSLSKYPEKTLHIFLIDRSPEIESVVASFLQATSRDVCVCRQTATLNVNPIRLHIDWVMELVEKLDFKSITIIDSDFELHSEWYERIAALQELLESRPEIKLFTAFNNCNGSGWRHATNEMDVLGGTGFGIKHDCGAGQMLMTKETFFQLGPMEHVHQDFTWVFRCRELNYLTATTIPSYAQHLGAATSKLDHSVVTPIFQDAALDYVGDYKIPYMLCGIWLLNEKGAQPFFIHPDGLVTAERNISFSNIIGHVSTNSSHFVITFQERTLCFRMPDKWRGGSVLKEEETGQKLFRLDGTDCHMVTSLGLYNIFFCDGTYYALACTAEISRMDIDQLKIDQKNGLAFAYENLEEIVQKINSVTPKE